MTCTKGLTVYCAVGRKRVLEIDKEIGRKIRFMRITNHYTQIEFSKILGVSIQQIQKYETGVNRISAGNLYALVHHLKMDLYSFFGEHLPPEEKEVIEAILLDKQLEKLFKILGSIKNKNLLAKVLDLINRKK